MANSNRRLPDREGKMFIPNSIDRNTGEEDSKFSAGSIVVLGVLLVGDVLTALALLGGEFNRNFNIIVWVGLLIINLVIIDRNVVGSSKYKKVIDKIKEYNGVTPAKFWDISNIENYTEGSIAEFTDGRIGVYVRLDRDTLIGHSEEFREEFYDNISDVYKDLNELGYSFVIMNIMNSAGKDKRIETLDEVVSKANESNAALGEIMAMQVEHIKKITENNLYEEEIMFIGTTDRNNRDNFIDNVIMILGRLVNSGYSGFEILKEYDIKEFAKYEFGVKEFDIEEAQKLTLINDIEESGAVKIVKIGRDNEEDDSESSIKDELR